MKLIAIEGGFDGKRTYEPGEKISIADLGHVRRLVILGHAVVIDDDGNPVPVDVVIRSLRLSGWDLLQAFGDPPKLPGLPVKEEPSDAAA